MLEGVIYFDNITLSFFGGVYMFDIALTFLTQLVGLIPAILGLILLFDFIGLLLFDRR